MEHNIAYETSISNLRRLIENDKSDKFKIIFKFVCQGSETSSMQNEKTKKYEIITTVNQARVISKKINDIYLIDPTVDTYEINYSTNNNITAEYSGNIEALLHKILNSILKEVTINEEYRQDFYKLLIYLGEQSNATRKEMNFSISSIEEAISLLFTEFHDNSIFYLSSRFKEFISKRDSDKINSEIIHEIIDAYFNFRLQEDREKDESEEIFELMKSKSEDYRVVMHFLIGLGLEEMSNSMIEYFYEYLDDDIVEQEMSKVIPILRHHLIKICEKHENKKTVEIESNIEFEGNELKGICEYLVRTKGQNVGNDDNLKLSGGGSINPFYPLTSLIKYDSNNINNYYFNYSGSDARSESDAWIEFDFCKRKVNLSSYTIRSNDNSPDSWFHPKSWRIVGSNDGENWDVIDRRTNNSDLNGVYKQHRFECSNNSSNYYRYIRYIQEDICFNDPRKYNIYLTCIEFFGSISTAKET